MDMMPLLYMATVHVMFCTCAHELEKVAVLDTTVGGPLQLHRFCDIVDCALTRAVRSC